jgi:hypothetical protein
MENKDIIRRSNEIELIIGNETLIDARKGIFERIVSGG